MIKSFIESIPLDKLRHLAIGVLYSILIPLLALLMDLNGALIGFIIATLLNTYKEIYHDLYEGNGKPELLDFIYNEIPILIVFIAYIM
jgi:hypothetical protein